MFSIYVYIYASIYKTCRMCGAIQNYFEIIS